MPDPTHDPTPFELAADLGPVETGSVLTALRAALASGPLHLETATPNVRVPCLQLLLATVASGRTVGQAVALGPNARAALSRYGAGDPA